MIRHPLVTIAEAVLTDARSKMGLTPWGRSGRREPTGHSPDCRATGARWQGEGSHTTSVTMKTRAALKTGCTLLFVVLAFGTHLFADDIPTFIDPDVNTFVKLYAQFVTDYVDAYKAAQAGDNSKLQALQPKSRELQVQAAQIPGKITPDEADKFSAFIGRCSEKISDVTKQ